MANVELNDFQYKVLSHIYQFTKKGTGPVIPSKLANIVGIPWEQFLPACQVFEKHLLINVANGAVWMTPRGVRVAEGTSEPSSSVTHNTTNVNAPNSGNIQTGGIGNIQNIGATNNSEFNDSIRSVLDLIQSSKTLEPDVKEDVIRDLLIVDTIAIQEPSALGTDRAKAKLAYIDTVLKASDVALKAAPYLPHLYSFFENLTR